MYMELWSVTEIVTWANLPTVRLEGKFSWSNWIKSAP